MSTDCGSFSRWRSNGGEIFYRSIDRYLISDPVENCDTELAFGQSKRPGRRRLTWPPPISIPIADKILDKMCLIDFKLDEPAGPVRTTLGLIIESNINRKGEFIAPPFSLSESDSGAGTWTFTTLFYTDRRLLARFP